MRVSIVAAVWVLSQMELCTQRDPDPLPPPASIGACDGGTADDVPVPGFAGRPYTVRLPAGYTCQEPAPVVLAIHGGSGNALAMARSTCPAPWKGLGKPPTDVDAAGCLNALADREHFIVVYPNGTLDPDSPIRNARTWNAGGGRDGYHCVSFKACKEDVDDVAYFRAVLDDVERRYNVDDKRVYATGISNGAAMSYRLGCELSDRIAAIAPVAGGFQLAATGRCAPRRPVPLLHIHGTDDSWWRYEGGANGRRAFKGKHVSVCESVWGSKQCPGSQRSSDREIVGWAEHNGCRGELVETPWDPSPDDATTRVVVVVPSSCPAAGEVELLRIEGGGHTWPNGWQYLPPERKGLVPGVGIVSQEFSANERIWEFFRRHRLSPAK